MTDILIREVDDAIAERLRQVEEAEAFLRRVGVIGDLRVRHLGTAAQVETATSQHPLLRDRWSEVETVMLGLGFERVELDPEGYRRGRLLALAPSPS